MVMKKCQIHATSPITCFTVPIVGTTELNLTHDEIYNCLCAKAEVMEILANGKMINLDFTNYNRDNSIIGEPVEEIVIPFEEETPEPIEPEVEEIEVATENQLSVVEEDDEVVVAETITNATEDTETVIKADELVSIEDEIAETVKEFKVESRNNNNHKNNKNKKKK